MLVLQLIFSPHCCRHMQVVGGGLGGPAVQMGEAGQLQPVTHCHQGGAVGMAAQRLLGRAQHMLVVQSIFSLHCCRHMQVGGGGGLGGPAVQMGEAGQLQPVTECPTFLSQGQDGPISGRGMETP